MIEALCKPGRDPREDLPPPIFRKDIVKFEDLLPGMELRGTVLNVVDFGAFVDIGLSDSGLVHISQLSAGYVRDPHDVVAVGDQVRVWVAAIDKDRRRVALTMIAPGTERPQARRGRAGRAAAKRRNSRLAQPPAETARTPPPNASRCRRAVRRKPRGDRRGRREDAATRANRRLRKARAKTLVPITKEMEEGKEFLRSFGDLLQFHQKKKEQDKPSRTRRSHPATRTAQRQEVATGSPKSGESQRLGMTFWLSTLDP